VPAHARLEELRAEITDLERRIERQVANLEAEDATPSLRRRVGARGGVGPDLRRLVRLRQRIWLRLRRRPAARWGIGRCAGSIMIPSGLMHSDGLECQAVSGGHP
jgi:hypothetical protein